MGQSWLSYDAISAGYDRLAAPHVFAPVAQDLVALLELPQGAITLDVGTGSGVAALAALNSIGGVAVGLDLSIEMLRLARRNGVSRVVCGAVPGLPLPGSVFDGVFANFVLNHVNSYQAALCDMVRVLRSGRRWGGSAWGPLQSEYRQLWRELVESAVGAEALKQALREATPWEEWFSDPEHLRAAVEDAGLVKVEIEQRAYTVRLPMADYLSMREISLQARFTRRFLGSTQWEHFRETVSNTFVGRFREPIQETNLAYLCTGTKP